MVNLLDSSITTSSITVASDELVKEFNVSSTASFLPLSLYVTSLGFGPILGGPLSETVGRYPVYASILPLGTLFTLSTGFVYNFGGLFFLRFMTGFSCSPSLALASGSISETFRPKTRHPSSALFNLAPFLGPGLGPVIGSFFCKSQGLTVDAADYDLLYYIYNDSGSPRRLTTPRLSCVLRKSKERSYFLQIPCLPS